MSGRATMKAVAYHEAGHALARWWLGFHTDNVVVLTDEQVQAGATIENRNGHAQSGFVGMVNGYDIHMPLPRETVNGDCDEQARTLVLRKAPIRAEMAVVELHAGPFAEAKYRKISAFQAFLFDGEHDARNARKILDEWCTDEAEHSRAYLRADTIAAALVRSPKAQVALERMAIALVAHGEIDGSRVEAICSEAYDGAELRHDRWADSWPPTPKQIREGFLPIRASP